MKSDPCSAIITVGAFVLPDVIRGMIEASITRKPYLNRETVMMQEHIAMLETHLPYKR